MARQKIGPHGLRVGGRYLHMHRDTYLQIWAINDSTVRWQDHLGFGDCDPAYFARICQYEATSDEVAAIDRRYPRPTSSVAEATSSEPRQWW